MFSVERAHDSAVHEMFGLAVDVGAAVEKERDAFGRRNWRSDSGTPDTVNAFENELGGGNSGTG